MLPSFWRGPFILSRPTHGWIGWSLTAADFLQRTGAGPVEARVINRGFNISWRGGPPSKTIRAATRPFWTPKPSTVVSGGSERSASGISLWPTTERSRGTDRPRRRVLLIAAIACIADI